MTFLVIGALMVKTHLEDSKQRHVKCIKVASWFSLLKIKLAAKELHAEKGKYNNKEEE